ncbi:type IV secretion system DNA-binding domain-containing protein [Burkholderia vietnamiensis]|uniref:type IV secretion system DNA-binding domain-containing protein n=1 Tax=Burkholderia vietnamiensis TaxID=60552 RepID=UPI001BA02B25|nr:type IV secretion system DNA-binding domain-containing protein [Burkholderia vietnamiensis]MBR8007414.1 type IV secretion system DNA-binding domain-containing protein [Burkholderia vietnamiensis]
MSKSSHPADFPVWTHWFGPLPQNLPPSTLVRYVGEALVLGTLTFVVLALALIGGLWHRLPGFGDAFTAYIGPSGQIVPLPLKLHLRLWFEIPFSLWSHGRFFGPQVSAYASLVQQLPFAMFYGRLLFAGSLALIVAGYVTKLALRPRDRLIHVSGERLLRGVEAERAAQLESKAVKPYVWLHPSLALSKDNMTEHVLISGGVGGGKTQILHRTLRQIVAIQHRQLWRDIAALLESTSITDEQRHRLLAPLRATALPKGEAAEPQATDVESWRGRFKKSSAGTRRELRRLVAALNDELGIRPDPARPKTKLLLYDRKGDFTERYPDGVIVSPWDARSAVWDIAKDLVDVSARRAMASILSPTFDGDKNKWLNDGAAGVIYAILESLYADFGMSWGWHQLLERGAYPHGQLYKLVQQHNPVIAKTIADADNMGTQSILGAVGQAFTVVSQLTLAWGDVGPERPRFSMREFLDDRYQGEPMLILRNGRDESLAKAYISVLFNVAQTQMMNVEDTDNSHNDGRAVFFVIDEFTSIGRLAVEALTAVGRSKGCMVILGFQDKAQINSTYDQNFASSLESMVGTNVVCRLGPGDTRDRMTRLIGERLVGTVNMNTSLSAGGTSSTTAYSESKRALIDPSELTALGKIDVPKTKDNPKGFAIRAIVLRNGKAKLLAFPGVVLPKVRPFYVEADWCKPYGAVSAGGGTAPPAAATDAATDVIAIAVTTQAPAAQVAADHGNVEVAAASVVPGPPSVDAASATSVETVVTVTAADMEYQAMFDELDGVTNSPPDVGEGGDPMAEIAGVAAEQAVTSVADVVVGALGGHLVEAVAAGAKVLDATGGSADPRPPKQTMHFRPVHLD